MKYLWFLGILLFLLPSFYYVGLLQFSDSTKVQKQKMLNENQFISPVIPEKLNFCGEIVPIEDFEVKERLEKELILATYQHYTTLLLIKKSKRWKNIILPILEKENIPSDFFYLMCAESHFQTHATSNRGAQGLWQFMPETAKFYKMEVNAYVDERNDPIQSTYAACKFLKDAYKKLGNWTLVASAYNRGLSGILTDMKLQMSENYHDLFLNSETSRYVFRILALKTIMENPEQYGYKLFSQDYDPDIPVVEVKVNTPIPNLAQFAKTQKTTYKHLKVLNPWLVGTQLPNPTGKTYTILFPKN